MVRRIRALFAVIFVMVSTTTYASDVSVYIDESIVEFDVPPAINDGRAMVPMRKIFEELGCEVEWLSDSQTIIATKNAKIMALQIGKNKIILTDIETNITEVYELDVAPQIMDGRTLVPVRAISELLDYSVEWDSVTYQVKIYTEKVMDE